MVDATAVVRCASCGAHLAHDHHLDTICSPCRRTEIERSARRGAVLAKDGSQIKTAFETSGLYAVAEQLDCSPEEALDVLMAARLLPVVSPRRRRLLGQLAALRGYSHVAAAEALNISRWTVATYRSQLGIDRSSAPGSQSAKARRG
jgi:predicted RNA-binding Zn-ribbon protein involved in translation (DUF1610 family)